MGEVPYLAELGELARNQVARRLPAIAAALQSSDHWEETYEWRISTIMTSRIERVERDRGRSFRVSVACDAEFKCHAPTLERAIEYMGIFEDLTYGLFDTFGWASWATSERPEAKEGENTP